MALENILSTTWIFGWYAYIWLQSWLNYYVTIMSFITAFIGGDWMTVEQDAQDAVYTLLDNLY